jgi:hypothetical protein
VLAGLLSVTALVSASGMAEPASSAPTIGPLTFSSGMTADFQPAVAYGIDFPADNDGVWVTFTFSDLPAGSAIHRIVRFEGDDYNSDEDPYGPLNCCTAGGSGRYGFRIVRIDGQPGQLPGGAYDVRIYLNGQQVQQAGFGVRGGQGSGKDELPGGNNNNNNNGNDND